MAIATLGIFVHDCPNCVYQFSVVESCKMPYDVYICENGGEKAIILRFGNSPEENKSMPYSIFETIQSEEYAKIREMIDLKYSLKI